MPDGQLDLIIPPSLARQQVQSGVHRKGMKVLAWGGPGGGKSFLAASFPDPKVVFIHGDNGIESYLDPEQTRVFDLQNPDQMMSGLDFVLANEHKLASVVYDPISLAWEDWLDAFNSKFDGEIRAHQWKEVKGPWKVMWRKLMRSPLHLCVTAWVNDIIYERTGGGPGEEGRLNIRAQETPKVEKRIPHVFDLAVQCSVELDQKNQPTHFHTVRVTKARRPRTVKPEDLHIGKTWRFNEMKPVSPWEAVFEPILKSWADGAVEYLGIDPRNVTMDMQDMDRIYGDQLAGQILRKIEKQTDLAEYREIWRRELETSVNELKTVNVESFNLVVAAHNKKKEELGPHEN
jgi:hypothetical protein